MKRIIPIILITLAGFFVAGNAMAGVTKDLRQKLSLRLEVTKEFTESQKSFFRKATVEENFADLRLTASFSRVGVFGGLGIQLTDERTARAKLGVGFRFL